MANILWMDSKKCDGFSLEMYWKIHHKILCWKKKQSHIFVDICDGPEGLRDGFFLGKALANPSQNSWLRMAGILRMDLDFFLRWISLWKWIGKSITKFCAERKCTTTFLWWIPITKFFANIFVMNVRNKLRLIFPLEMSWKIDHKLLAENCRHFANGPRKNCCGFFPGHVFWESITKRMARIFCEYQKFARRIYPWK